LLSSTARPSDNAYRRFLPLALHRSTLIGAGPPRLFELLRLQVAALPIFVAEHPGALLLPQAGARDPLGRLGEIVSLGRRRLVAHADDPESIRELIFFRYRRFRHDPDTAMQRAILRLMPAQSSERQRA
jgi:hypothetical protein